MKLLYLSAYLIWINSYLTLHSVFAQEPLTSIQAIQFSENISSLNFHPNHEKKRLLIGSNRNVYWLDWKSKKTHLILHSPSSTCHLGIWKLSPRGSYLYSSSQGRCIDNLRKNNRLNKMTSLWDIRNWKLKKKAKVLYIGKHLERTSLFQMGPLSKENYLMSVQKDGIVKYWSLQKKKITQSLRVPKKTPERLAIVPYAISPSLRIIAFHHWQDYYMLLYKIYSPFSYSPTKGKIVQAKLLHRTEYPFTNSQKLFCFSSDSTIYFDGVRIRQVKDGKILSKFIYQKNTKPQRALFHPNKNILAIESKIINNKNRKIKYVTKKNISLKSPYPKGHIIELYNIKKKITFASIALEGPVVAMAFHPAGKLMSIALTNKHIYLYQIYK